MGALTLKPLEGEVRQWELFENESIDLTDSFGASIRIASREDRIFFAEPFDSNLPWITDRSRMFFEGYTNKEKELAGTVFEGIFKEVENSLYFLNHLREHQLFKSTPFLFTIVFKRLGLEDLALLKIIKTKYSFIKIRSGEPSFVNRDLECNAQLTPSLNAKIQLSSLAVLIGTNTRYEGHALNQILRQRYLKGGFSLFSFSSLLCLTVPSHFVGSTYETIVHLSEGVSPNCQDVKKSDLPMFVTNSAFFKNPLAASLVGMLKYVQQSCYASNNISVLASSLETSGNFHLSGFLNVTERDLIDTKKILFLNADLETNPELESLVRRTALKSTQRSAKNKIIFDLSDACSQPVKEVPSFSSYYSSRFSYIRIPTKTPFENSNTYLNTKGKSRKALKILDNSSAKSSWEMMRKLSSSFQKVTFLSSRKNNSILLQLMGNSTNQDSCLNFLVRPIQNITSMAKEISTKSEPFEAQFFLKSNFKNRKKYFRNFKVKQPFDDVFVGGNRDLLSRRSQTLIKCSKSVRSKSTNFF